MSLFFSMRTAKPIPAGKYERVFQVSGLLITDSDLGSNR